MVSWYVGCCCAVCVPECCPDTARPSTATVDMGTPGWTTITPDPGECANCELFGGEYELDRQGSDCVWTYHDAEFSDCENAICNDLDFRLELEARPIYDGFDIIGYECWLVCDIGIGTGVDNDDNDHCPFWIAATFEAQIESCFGEFELDFVSGFTSWDIARCDGDWPLTITVTL